LNLWSNNARGKSHKLGLWGHFDGKFYNKEGDKEEKAQNFSKFLNFGRSLMKKKESDDDS